MTVGFFLKNIQKHLFYLTSLLFYLKRLRVKNIQADSFQPFPDLL